MHKTMPDDWAREMGHLRLLEQQTGIEVYCAHPHSA